ncbi:2-oxoglutarate dehydrogenase E1 component, partial [Coemansia helicoidea]
MSSLLRAARCQALRPHAAAAAIGARRVAGSAFPAAAGHLAARRTKATSATESGPPHPSESFLSGNVTPYVEQMYESYLQDPASVHASWRSYFKNVDKGLKPGQA